ncbi:hypothetical protein M441DRAFT_363134 [Trichoderma asperellum CBS 433.97]|uniref:Transmembrane protein n=1 Tax=Trichoderma asperellum (strain ATCC 204424 / CBS 433.97 / NBRC 101777) TaxID=1042311 RepID=A0A2T3ZDY0_TRIA4|nr:hypothetical protein M441DRAFT_363134 [Trichoderma asperellum CBS 433.97]PTB43005.1 hypothetical protein M441DRAFT_363134 [Trichoderma asperellum CBS 433.97]
MRPGWCRSADSVQPSSLSLILLLRLLAFASLSSLYLWLGGFFSLLFVFAFVFALTCLADAVAAASLAVDFHLLAELHFLPCCVLCLCFVKSSLSRCSFSPSLLFPTSKHQDIRCRFWNLRR